MIHPSIRMYVSILFKAQLIKCVNNPDPATRVHLLLLRLEDYEAGRSADSKRCRSLQQQHLRRKLSKLNEHMINL